MKKQKLKKYFTHFAAFVLIATMLSASTSFSVREYVKAALVKFYIERQTHETFLDSRTLRDRATDSLENKAVKYVLENTGERFDYIEFYKKYLRPVAPIFDSTYAANNNFYVDKVQNELSEKKIQLGKYLFFDPILSQNVKRSCASCHRPEKAFTDQRTVSRAYNFSENLERNAPTLINVGKENIYFHDGRAHSLDGVIQTVIENPKEFSSSYALIISRLKQSEAYKKLFFEAFSLTDTITNYAINESIKAFVNSLTGFNSPFDAFMQGKNNIDTKTQKGFLVFMGVGGCGKCHRMPTFGGSHYPIDGTTDFCLVGKRKIKIPTLRNVALTSPYMFDGRINSLEQIFADSLHLNDFRKNRIALKSEDKDNIILFLNSLTEKTNNFEKQTLPENYLFAKRRVGGMY